MWFTKRKLKSSTAGVAYYGLLQAVMAFTKQTLETIAESTVVESSGYHHFTQNNSATDGSAQGAQNRHRSVRKVYTGPDPRTPERFFFESIFGSPIPLPEDRQGMVLTKNGIRFAEQVRHSESRKR